jgi:hypothetical protein
MEPDGSLPYTPVPDNCPYPEPTLSSPRNPLQLPTVPVIFRQTWNQIYQSEFLLQFQQILLHSMLLLYYIKINCNSKIPAQTTVDIVIPV